MNISIKELYRHLGCNYDSNGLSFTAFSVNSVHTGNNFKVLGAVFSKNEYTDEIVLMSSVESELGPIPIQHLGHEALFEIKCGKLIIPDTYTILHEYSLSGLEAKQLIIPKSVTELPMCLFAESYIGEIIFEAPENIIKIEKGAFSNMKYLGKMTWPSGCTIIPEGCFAYTEIGELNGFENIEKVKSGAFLETTGITEFRWPDKCAKIPSLCFQWSSLNSITNFEHVTKIGKMAFYESNLQGALKFSSVETIKKKAFAGTSLESVLLANDNKRLFVDSTAFDCPIAVSGVKVVETKKNKHRKLVIDADYDVKIRTLGK